MTNRLILLISFLLPLGGAFAGEKPDSAGEPKNFYISPTPEEKAEGPARALRLTVEEGELEFDFCDAENLTFSNCEPVTTGGPFRQWIFVAAANAREKQLQRVKCASWNVPKYVRCQSEKNAAVRAADQLAVAADFCGKVSGSTDFMIYEGTEAQLVQTLRDITALYLEVADTEQAFPL